MLDQDKPRDQSGFTLIELMIVVVIIGVLASLALPRFNALAQSSKEAEADGILKEVYTLQQSYYGRFNQFAEATELAKYGFLLELGSIARADAEGRYYYLDIAGTGGTGTDATYCAVARLTTRGVSQSINVKSMGSDRIIRVGATTCN